MGDLRNGHLTDSLLAAGHGYRRVVQQLVGDIRAARYCGPDREASGMVEGAIADVLQHVLACEERCHAEPLGSFAAHLSQAADVANLRWLHAEHKAVTPNSGSDQRTRRCLG